MRVARFGALLALTCTPLYAPRQACAEVAPTDAPATDAPAKSSAELEPEPVEPVPVTSTDEMDYLALADAPVFLPRSYLYWGSPVGAQNNRQSLIFALEYALHLPAYNDLRDKAAAGKSWAGAATLSFEGDLRMLKEPSKPVRMPSYRPSLSGQLFYIWQRPMPLLLGLRAGLFHYSNGQDRCLFDPGLREEVVACRVAFAETRVPWRALNRDTGNFSLNGWLLEANARLHHINARGVAIGHIGFGLSAAGNLGRWSIEPPLRKLYGWGRLRASVEARRLFGWSALTLRAAVAGYPDTGAQVPAASGQLEVAINPYWLTGLGFFARYFGGRDFYNAFFVDRIQQVALGLAWDGERPLKFKPHPE